MAFDDVVFSYGAVSCLDCGAQFKGGMKDAKQHQCPARGNDPVNHPSHYTFSTIEVIDALEAWQLGYHEACAVKYIARAQHKGNELQDLKKARWYIDRRIAQLEGKNFVPCTHVYDPGPGFAEQHCTLALHHGGSHIFKEKEDT